MTQQGQISVQEISDEDGQKFPALFGVRQIIKSDPEGARSQLIEEAPSGCPPRFYQSVALSVLACFVEDEEIMSHASVLFNIPELLTIIDNSDSEEFEDDIMLINDAWRVLSAMVSSQEGREAFIASRGVMVLTDLNIRQSFQDEEALELLLDILTYERDKSWKYHLGNKVKQDNELDQIQTVIQDLFNLLKKITEDYDKLSGCDEFDVIGIITTVLESLPSDCTDIYGAPLSNSEPAGMEEMRKQSDRVQIGSVIEIYPICDNIKIYLTFLHFERVEELVNTAVYPTDKLLGSCSWELESEMTNPAFQYKQFNCRPTNKIFIEP